MSHKDRTLEYAQNIANLDSELYLTLIPIVKKYKRLGFTGQEITQRIQGAGIVLWKLEKQGKL